MRSKKVRFFLPLSRYEIEILISPIQKILQTLNITYSLFSGVPVHWPAVAEPRVWVRGECGQWSGPHHPPAQAVHWPRAAPEPRLPDRHSDPALLLQHGRQLLLEPPVRREQRDQHGRGEQDIQLEWDISVRGALLHHNIKHILIHSVALKRKFIQKSFGSQNHEMSEIISLF